MFMFQSYGLDYIVAAEILRATSDHYAVGLQTTEGTLVVLLMGLLASALSTNTQTHKGHA